MNKSISSYGDLVSGLIRRPFGDRYERFDVGVDSTQMECDFAVKRLFYPLIVAMARRIQYCRPQIGCNSPSNGLVLTVTQRVDLAMNWPLTIIRQ